MAFIATRPIPTRPNAVSIWGRKVSLASASALHAGAPTHHRTVCQHLSHHFQAQEILRRALMRPPGQRECLAIRLAIQSVLQVLARMTAIGSMEALLT